MEEPALVFEHGDRRTLTMHTQGLSALYAAVELCAQPRRCAVQAGGALGVFPKVLSQFFEMVYTFEPDPYNFSILNKNCPELNICRIQAALGDQLGMCDMVRKRRDTSAMPFNTGMSYVNRLKGGSWPIVRLDDMGIGSDRVDLIYLDVEGSEIEALTGAYLTIRQWSPVIAVEVNKQLAAAGRTPQELYEVLTNMLYRHYITIGSDQIWVTMDATRANIPGPIAKERKSVDRPIQTA